MNGNNSFAERNAGANLGEELFEQYCKEKQVFFKRLGFDEKKDKISEFYKLPTYIRNLPDYLVVTPKGHRLIMVKGTANIKQAEVNMIPLFLEWYYSKDCPLYYAFCFKDKKIAFRTPDQVIELYQGATDKQWSDKVIYRTLAL
jgi:hypothetical protein